MFSILTDILIVLTRAAIATFLANELYAITIPGSLVFSVTLYAVLTRDPLRASLPPWMGFGGMWFVMRGRWRRKVRRGRAIVRLSIFGRDAFWISEQVLGELLSSGGVEQVFYKSGCVLEYGSNERMAVDKVLSLENLSLYDDVIDQESARFIEKVAKAKKVGASLINEYVVRVLHRIAYGTADVNRSRRIKFTSRKRVHRLLLSYYFPFLFGKRPRNSRNPPPDVLPETHCLESQLSSQILLDPTVLAGYIVDNNASLIGSGLHQSLIGLLSNYKVARDLQDELETLIDAKNKLSLKDLIGLPILPAIVAESMRLTILKTPSDVCYRLSEDMWYRKWFLPKGSIVILDRDMIFPTVRLTDPQFRPERFFEKFPSKEVVDAVAFAYGIPGRNLVKMVMSISLATILRKFNISRGPDGKVKLVQFTVRSAVEG